MALYIMLNLAFIAVIMILFRIRFRRMSTKSWWIAFAILLALTAVFDSLIVGFDIVAYDSQKILGVYIGNAPVEDFFYTVLAMLVIPALWTLFGGIDDDRNA